MYFVLKFYLLTNYTQHWYQADMHQTEVILTCKIVSTLRTSLKSSSLLLISLFQIMEVISKYNINLLLICKESIKQTRHNFLQMFTSRMV